MSDEKELSEESMLALDEAAWTYMEAVKKILEKHSDTELLEYAGVNPERDSKMFDKFVKFQAKLEVMYRDLYKRAKPTLDRPDFSGAFCVFHDCDAKDCRDKHDDD